MHPILSAYGKELASAAAEITGNCSADEIRISYSPKPAEWQMMLTLPYSCAGDGFAMPKDTLPYDGCGFEFTPPVSLKVCFGADAWIKLARAAAELPRTEMPHLMPDNPLFFAQAAYMHLDRRTTGRMYSVRTPDGDDKAILYELLTRPGANIAKRLTRKYSGELCIGETPGLFAIACIRLYGEYIRGLIG